MKAGRAALSALVLVMGLFSPGACGGDDSPADRAFGGLSNADESQLREWSRGLRQLPKAQVAIFRSFQTEDVTSARSGLNRFHRIVSDSADLTLDFESGGVRNILQDYLAPIEHYGATLDRFVGTWEQEVDTGVPANDIVVNDLLEDLQLAAERVQRNERRMTNRLLDEMSPEQQDEFRLQLRRLQSQFEAQATSPP